MTTYSKISARYNVPIFSAFIAKQFKEHYKNKLTLSEFIKTYKFCLKQEDISGIKKLNKLEYFK